jgi:hypothetical protein
VGVLEMYAWLLVILFRCSASPAHVNSGCNHATLSASLVPVSSMNGDLPGPCSGLEGFVNHLHFVHKFLPALVVCDGVSGCMLPHARGMWDAHLIVIVT